MEKQKIIFVTAQLNAYGAERMAALLCNEFVKRGRSVTLLVTHQKSCDAYTEILSPHVEMIFLEDEPAAVKHHRLTAEALMLKARAIAKLERILLNADRDSYSVRKYLSRNYDKIHWMKKYFRRNPDAAVVSFFYQSIFHTLLAFDPRNRVIISERSDPQQCYHGRTNQAFFHTMFPKADTIVVQSEGAKEWYDRHTGANTAIIYNPVRDDLPQAYTEERNHTVVNFCRYARQKNLILLIDAFSAFYRTHPDYELKIIGGPSKDGGQEYIDQVRSHSAASGCAEAIHLSPESLHVHEDIQRDGMFVSSSNYEGMSNSMLEAMALGLPVVCTDCPAGGARAVIRDHENGLLTPVGDAEALAKAMAEIADSTALAKKLSENGVKIRERLSTEKIICQWLDVIEGKPR